MNTTLSRPSMAKFAPVFAALVALLLVLTGCASGPSGSTDSDGESVTKFRIAQPGIENIITYHSEGDIVTKQISESVIEYQAGFGTDDADEVKSQIEPTSEQYRQVNGVKYDITYGDTEVTEIVEIDYTVAEVSDLVNLPGADFEGDFDANQISLKQSRELLLNSGYEEIN